MSINIVPINEVYKNICLVTFTSSGYNDITKNLSKSIEVNNVNYNLNIFCLDEESNMFRCWVSEAKESHFMLPVDF